MGQRKSFGEENGTKKPFELKMKQKRRFEMNKWSALEWKTKQNKESENWNKTERSSEKQEYAFIRIRNKRSVCVEKLTEKERQKINEVELLIGKRNENKAF